MDYKPENFSDLAGTPLGLALWSFMNESDNIVRMETATYLRRVAVEPLSPYLKERFGEKSVSVHRIKQMIGHMARQVLESRGHTHERTHVRIARPRNLFTSGSRYTHRPFKAGE